MVDLYNKNFKTLKKEVERLEWENQMWGREEGEGRRWKRDNYTKDHLRCYMKNYCSRGF